MSTLAGPRIGKRRLFVLGVDGLPFSLLNDLRQRDFLPNFRALLSQGSLKRMNSVIPCVSSVAWASYMTGMNPGRHGIFGFLDRVPDTMEPFVPTSTHMRAETIWEWLSKDGKTVVVVNVPGTYPPRMVNGILVAGFLCPDIDKISYPREVARDLRARGYRIDIDSWKARSSKDDLLAEVNDALEKRFEVAFGLMSRVDWDFFQLHIMETDRINHFLWGHWKHRDPVYGRVFLNLYQKLDGYLGALVDRIGDQTDLIILSDHGFCELKREVYLNRWLEQEGFLGMRTGTDSVSDIQPRSRAYTLYPGRVYVNLKGREATGIVTEGREYERTRESLMGSLMGLRDPENGKSIIRKVIKREEVYSGPYLRSAPDLVALPHDGYDLKGNFSKTTLTAKSAVVGMHTDDDAFLYVKDQEIQTKDNGFGIMDAYTAVLNLLGLRKPEGLDAKDLF